MGRSHTGLSWKSAVSFVMEIQVFWGNCSAGFVAQHRGESVQSVGVFIFRYGFLQYTVVQIVALILSCVCVLLLQAE